MLSTRAPIALLAAWPLACAPTPVGRPDVLLITVDTLRRDHVGLHGYGRETTPHIDAFFANGSIYEAAISPAPCTVPAVKQVLTGAIDFDERRPRLAELLASVGYRTGAVVSQYHFRNEDGPRPAYARGFEFFDVQGADEKTEFAMSTRVAGTVTERALDWLANDDDTRPTFLWVHYFDPHDPYTAPSEHRVFPEPRPEVPGDRRAYRKELLAQDPTREAPRGFADYGGLFGADVVQTLIAYYDAEIRYTDAEVGRLLEVFGARARPSLVMLTSDHGERLGEGERWDHCQSLHSYEIDVPLLVAWPDGRAAERVAHAVSTLDLLPTVASVVGFSAPGELDGLDLRDVEAGRSVFARWRHEAVLCEDRWKLTVPLAGGPALLHDLAADPGEANDHATRRPQRTQRMMADLQSALEETAQVEERVESTLEELRAIGYLDGAESGASGPTGRE